MIKATVVYFVRGKGKNQKVLLGKKTKKICRGKLIGYGGKTEAGESSKNCAVREVKEEARVVIAPKDLVRIATIEYSDRLLNGTITNHRQVVYFFTRRWRGKFRSNGDLKNLRWYELNKAPLKKMMLGHSTWFELGFQGNYSTGSIVYEHNRRKIFSLDLQSRKRRKLANG